MSDATSAQIEAGRRDLEQHAWGSAYAAFRQADVSGPLEPDALEQLGEAAWWLGRLDEVIAAFERAYAAYQAAGRRRDAARVALRLSAEFGHKREHAVASGWLSRGERLLADEPEAAEHARLARARFARAFGRGDHEEALRHAETTYAIGERLGDPDLLALGLHDRGRALVARGDVAQGMALIDEATVAAVGGELSPHATAFIYCNTIETCRNLADYGRAAEWTDAAKRWCERQAIAGFPGICRVRRAEIVRLRGAWPEAGHVLPRLCRRRLLRARRDPPAHGRPGGRRGVLPAGGGAGPRPTARARHAASRRGPAGGRRRDAAPCARG
jgi:tetratricopeptide (TPR) repeat protein